MILADRPYGYHPRCFCGSLGHCKIAGKQFFRICPTLVGQGNSLPPFHAQLPRSALRFFVGGFDCGAISFFCSHWCRVLLLVDKRSSSNGNSSNNNKYRSTTSHRSPPRRRAATLRAARNNQSSQEQRRQAPPGQLQQEYFVHQVGSTYRSMHAVKKCY